MESKLRHDTTTERYIIKAKIDNALYQLPNMIKQKLGENPFLDTNIKTLKRNSNASGGKS